MSVAFFYLIFGITLHACSARPLGFVHSEENKVEPLSTQRLINVKDSLRAEVETRKNLSLSSDGANTMLPKNLEALEKVEKDNRGKEVMLPLSEEFLQERAEVQNEKRQARLMIESPPPDNEEETMNSKENDMGEEDIVVMDYAQPHRKPPIHNKQP